MLKTMRKYDLKLFDFMQSFSVPSVKALNTPAIALPVPKKLKMLLSRNFLNLLSVLP